MRIALLTPFADSRGGGVSEVVFNLARTLAARGHEMRVIGRVAPEEGARITAEVPGLTPAEGWRSVARAVRSAPMEVMHAHGLWDPYLAVATRASRQRGVPVVVSPHGMLEGWALRQGRAKKRLALATYEGRNLTRAACVHALTRAEAAAVRALVPGAPVAVIPNGVALPDTEPTPAGDDKVLLYLGRIHQKKGILDLVTAFAAVAREGKAAGWRLTLAGWDDGGHLAEVQARIRALRIGERVRYIGPVFGAEKERLIAASAALALTSFSEGLPMTVLEAWSYGRPVLMTPECNLAEAANEGAAVLCETGAEAVAAGLRRLFGLTPAARDAMGRAGRGLVAARFDWGRVAEDFAWLYGWLAGRGERPAFVSYG